MKNRLKEFVVRLLLEYSYLAKKEIGLPASVMAAQAILETGYGAYVPIDSNTGKYSYNLFGIKGKGNAGKVNVLTHEYINGKNTLVRGEFAAYKSFYDSFLAYGELINNAERYKPALKVKTDPKKYIYALWECGYATDPKYPEKIIDIIKYWKLAKV